MRPHAAYLAAALLLAAAPGLAAETAPAPAKEAVDGPALARLVRQDCGSCHGLTLRGGLGPDIRPEALAHYDLQVLTSVILDGIPGTAMPPWRPLLTEAEAAWITDYLLNGASE